MWTPAQGIGLAGDAKNIGGTLIYPVRRLYTTTTSYTTSGTTIETAATYTLKPVLVTNGQKLRITIQGTSVSNANTKQATVSFGATSHTVTAGASTSVNWKTVVEITRLSATTQRMVTQNNYGPSWNTTQRSSPSETLSGDVVIKVELTTPTSAGDATFDEMTIELLE